MFPCTHCLALPCMTLQPCTHRLALPCMTLQPSPPEHCVIESKQDNMVDDLRCARAKEVIQLSIVCLNPSKITWLMT